MLKELERQALEQTTSHKVRFICKDKNWNDYIGITNICPAKDLADKIFMYGGLWGDYNFSDDSFKCQINTLKSGDTILDVYISSYDPNVIIDDMLEFRKEMWHKCNLEQYIQYGVNDREYMNIKNWDLERLWNIAKKLDVM